MNVRRITVAACSILLSLPVFASHDRTIEALVGHEIFVDDDFAGQSFILKRHGSAIDVVWRKMPSGSLNISANVYPAEVQNEKTCVFLVRVRPTEAEPNGARCALKVTLDGRELKVYLDGIRIQASEGRADDMPGLPSPDAPSPRTENNGSQPTR